MGKSRAAAGPQEWVPAWLLSRGGRLILLVATVCCLGGTSASVALAATNRAAGAAGSTVELTPLLAGDSLGLAWSIVCLAYLLLDRLGNWFAPSAH